MKILDLGILSREVEGIFRALLNVLEEGKFIHYIPWCGRLLVAVEARSRHHQLVMPVSARIDLYVKRRG